ncbi:MAG: alanine--glyoxylate aminotransferase family protein [Anaerolineales bacterium]
MCPLFIPGPVEVDESVLAAQAQPMLPHRGAKFEEIFHRTEAKARKIFQTKARVFMLACSGTGFHEAAVRNLVNKRMLSCVNGAFSQRWYQVAQTNGKHVDLLEVDWRQPITPELVAERVKKQHYEVVTIVHNETSTGMLNPVAEIAAAIHVISPETLICVDAVSSLGGAPLEMDAWGLDLVLASSQKALSLPPGLALCAVSDRALKRAEQVPNRGWYFDFLRLEKHRIENSTPTTPPMPLIFALDLQLDRILAEGLESRIDHHQALANRTEAWALGRGFGLFAPKGYRSPTVTAIETKPHIDLQQMIAYLAQRGFYIAAGYGKLKGSTFRIGHMGEIGMDDLDALLEAINQFLDQTK